MSDADVQITITLSAGSATKLRLLAQQRGAEAAHMVRDWIERELGQWVIDLSSQDRPTWEAILTEPRSLETALTDLTDKYYNLPERDPQRPELARMISQLKTEIERRANRQSG